VESSPGPSRPPSPRLPTVSSVYRYTGRQRGARRRRRVLAEAVPVGGVGGGGEYRESGRPRQGARQKRRGAGFTGHKSRRPSARRRCRHRHRPHDRNRRCRRAAYPQPLPPRLRRRAAAESAGSVPRCSRPPPPPPLRSPTERPASASGVRGECDATRRAATAAPVTVVAARWPQSALSWTSLRRHTTCGASSRPIHASCGR